MAETTFHAQAFTAGGTEREKVSLPSEVFDGTINMPVMHQAVRAYLANQRQGTAATKTRGFVAGGNQKPWRQKGTGRARQGSRRAPHWVGGGTVFGPSPRSYAEYVPRQVRALARKSALNARARENAIIVIDNFTYDVPKTQRFLELLQSLDVAEKKVLVLTDGVKPNVFLSCRNIPWAHVMPYSDVSTYHVLWSDVVLIESAALGMSLSPVAERERVRPARADRTQKAEARAPSGRSGRAAAEKSRVAKSEDRKTAKAAVKRPAASTRGKRAAAGDRAKGKTASTKKKRK
jgi:large subunit ribosomal protein L4